MKTKDITEKQSKQTQQAHEVDLNEHKTNININLAKHKT